jgi:hypothetical protein
MRICDRCGSRVCSERWKNFRLDHEIDFCAACNDDFTQWMADYALSREDKTTVEELKRRRGKPVTKEA